MAELSLPHARFRESFLAAMQEFGAEGRSGDDSRVGSDLERYGATWASEPGFSAYVEDLRAEARTPREAGFVCSSTWWWTEGASYVGRICVRHELTASLREVGGHIGYDVRRSRRREGQATAMLAAVLPEAAALGIDPALVTCDDDNLGSRAVIEANGGVLEDQRGRKLRYWVPTAARA